MTPAKWGLYPNFTQDEFACRHTGQCHMQHEFMLTLQAIRADLGAPMVITSGYRHWTHPVETIKGKTTGEHTRGTCCDVACSDSRMRFKLIMLALKHGCSRIGVAKNFLHIGIGDPALPTELPTEVIWEYA